MIVASHNIFLSSQFRDFGTSSAFTVFLKQTISKTKPSTRSFFNVRIASAEIPYSWKQLDTSNNTLPVAIDDISYNLTLEVGNYNIFQLLAEFKKKLLEVLPSASVLTSFSNTSNFVSVTIVVGSTIVIRFSENSFLAKMFGCDGDQTGSFTSVRPVNVNPVTSLLIRSDVFRQSGSYEAMCSSIDVSNAIAKIPIRSPPGTVIFFESTSYSSKIVNTVVDKISLSLTTNLSTIAVDLYGNDWTVHLIIDEVQIVSSIPEIDLSKPLGSRLEPEKKKLVEDGQEDQSS